MLREISRTTIQRVQAKNLAFHPVAGRPLDWNWVKKLADNLDEDALGVFHAVEYEIKGRRRLWLVDGAHRLAALIHRSLTELVVDVQLHPDVQDDARASALFLKLNDTCIQQEFEAKEDSRHQLEAEEMARTIERIYGLPPSSFKVH